jgi:hypothetical protein
MGTYCAPPCGGPLIDGNGEEYAVKVDQEAVTPLATVEVRGAKNFLPKDAIDDLLDKLKKTKDSKAKRNAQAARNHSAGANIDLEHDYLDRRNKSSPHTDSLSVPESKVKIEAEELLAQSARNPDCVGNGNTIEVLSPARAVYPRMAHQDNKKWDKSRKSGHFKSDGDNVHQSGDDNQWRSSQKPRPSSGGGTPTSALGGHEFLPSSKPGRGDTDPTPTPSQGYHSARPMPTEVNAGGGQNTTESKWTMMSSSDVLYRRDAPGSTVGSGDTDGVDTPSSKNAGAMIVRGDSDHHRRDMHPWNETGIDYDTIEAELDAEIDLELPDSILDPAFPPEYINEITHPNESNPYAPSKPTNPLSTFTIPHISRCNSTSTFPPLTINGTSTPISFNSTSYDDPEIVHREIAALVECGRAQAAGWWYDDGACTALFCKYWSGSTKAFAHSGYGVGSVYKMERGESGEKEDGGRNGKEGEYGHAFRGQ